MMQDGDRAAAKGAGAPEAGRWSGGLRTALCLALSGWIGCAGPVERPAPVRVAGRAGAGEAVTALIEGTQRRILDPARAEHAFALVDLPARPVLKLAIGWRPGESDGSIRFEVWLRPAAGEPIGVYARELSGPGWAEDSVDLGERPLAGARLDFRTRVTRGPKWLLQQGVWGEPVVLGATAPARPSAILVSVDSLRADRVGIYGGADTRTPALDALARDGAWYDAAYSSSTWTRPSHACLLYGMHFATLFGACEGSCPLPAEDSVRPLPEILHDAGYLTAGFTGGGFVAPQAGFGRGFDTYQACRPAAAGPACSPDRLDGPLVVSRAAEWLRAFGRAPFFLFLHTYDVHDDCPVRPPAVGAFQFWPKPDPDVLASIVEHYDRQVASIDRLLGELLAALDQLGLRETTLVVVTADHGQAFWEHGVQGHGCPGKPYDELVHVPLLLRFPASGWRPGRVETPVSTVDVAPTILKGLGIAAPPSMEGDVLPGLGLGGEASRPIYVHCGDVLGVRHEHYKLITSREGRFHDEVYDLAVDAGERDDLAGRGGAGEEALRARAAAYWKRVDPEQPPAPAEAVDDETRERLRALGYGD